MDSPYEIYLRYARHYARIAASVQQLYGEERQKAGLVVFDRERANMDRGRRWASDNAAGLEVASIVLVHAFAMAAVNNLRYDDGIDLNPSAE